MRILCGTILAAAMVLVAVSALKGCSLFGRRIGKLHIFRPIGC